jgi:hypothetical protein
MQITKSIADEKSDLDQHPEKVKFIVSNNSGSFEEICTYYDILEYLERDNNPLVDPEDQYHEFKDIIGHQDPLIPQDYIYKGIRYNVLIDWSDGEATYVQEMIQSAMRHMLRKKV